MLYRGEDAAGHQVRDNKSRSAFGALAKIELEMYLTGKKERKERVRTKVDVYRPERRKQLAKNLGTRADPHHAGGEKRNTMPDRHQRRTPLAGVRRRWSGTAYLKITKKASERNPDGDF